jgi:hypothetical protein
LRRLLAITLGMIMTVHLVFGCCWHHDHDDADHHSSQNCKELSCVYIVRSPVKTAELDGLDSPVCVHQIQNGPLPTPSLFTQNFFFMPPGLVPPVRLNLLNAVLLI